MEEKGGFSGQQKKGRDGGEMRADIKYESEQ